MSIDVISAQAAAIKWGVHIRIVQRYCLDGRIPGAQKYGNNWLIPAAAEKPGDGRRSGPPPSSSLAVELSALIEAASRPLPVAQPEGTPIREPRQRRQVQAELAYLRGDFKQTMACFTAAGRDEAARIYVAPMAIAAAISRGDYPFYSTIDAYLKGVIAAHPGTVMATYGELALATAAVSTIAANMAPDWLKNGDFSAIPPPLRPYTLYLQAKYFQCLGQYEPMLAVAQTVLTLQAGPPRITMVDIYLHLTCAIACHGLQRRDQARGYLLAAMALALPHGLISPFAESLTAFGGLLEQCLTEAYPDYYEPVIRQWQGTWRNWISFHNQFTKNNITDILTLREFHIATQVARRVPYTKIAAENGISVGRLKNIITEIYGKLLVSNRAELAQYVF